MPSISAKNSEISGRSFQIKLNTHAHLLTHPLLVLFPHRRSSVYKITVHMNTMTTHMLNAFSH